MLHAGCPVRTSWVPQRTPALDEATVVWSVWRSPHPKYLSKAVWRCVERARRYVCAFQTCFFHSVKIAATTAGSLWEKQRPDVFFSAYTSPAPRGTVPPHPMRRPTFGPRSECALDPGMVPSPTAQVCPLWVPHQVS